jgi:outer membrane biosynthesis protein TonB
MIRKLLVAAGLAAVLAGPAVAAEKAAHKTNTTVAQAAEEKKPAEGEKKEAKKKKKAEKKGEEKKEGETPAAGETKK